jgi:hypothetical protein
MKGRRCASKIAVLLMLAGLSEASAIATEVPLRPGQYLLTVTSQVQGERPSQSRSGTRCITESDLGNPEAVFSDQIAATRKGEAPCFVKELKNADGKISYDAECANRRVHVEGGLSGTEFSVVRMVRPKASPRILLKFVVSGKRTGDCRAAVGARDE